MSGNVSWASGKERLMLAPMQTLFDVGRLLWRVVALRPSLAVTFALPLAAMIFSFGACRGSESPRMKRLREKLASSPDWDAFCEVLRLFRPSAFDELPPWRDEAEAAQALDVADRALASWPDATRTAYDQNPCMRHSPWVVLPCARLIRRLEFYRNDTLGEDQMRAYGASPHMHDLREIVVFRGECDVLGPLARATEIRSLRSLTIVDNTVRRGSLTALAAAPHLGSLEHLKFFETAGIDADRFALLVDGAPGRSLREIELVGEPRITSFLDVILARDPLLRRLTVLNLSSSFLKDSDAEALARAWSLNRLETLDLRKNPGIGETGKRAIRTAPQFASTRVLFD